MQPVRHLCIRKLAPTPGRARCRQIHAALDAYVDGETDRRTEQIVDEHLSRCCECSEDAELLRCLKTALTAAAGTVTPDEVDRVRRRFRARLDTG